MIATEFQIASAMTLARARGPYIAGGASGIGLRASCGLRRRQVVKLLRFRWECFTDRPFQVYIGFRQRRFVPNHRACDSRIKYKRP
jgi:hypothetical protein